MNDPNKAILNTETKEQLEARDAELKKVMKLNLVLNELKCLKLGNEETPEIKRAIRQLFVADYIRLGDEQENTLDLQDCKNFPPLSYTDRKAVLNKLAANLQAKLSPIAELGDKIRAELPDVLLPREADTQLNESQQEIIKLQEEQRICLEKLFEKRKQKCALLVAAADLKMGPYLGQELQLQQAQAQYLQTKAEMLRMYLSNEVFSRTEHSLAAHKEVDKYLDELLSAKKPKGAGDGH